MLKQLLGLLENQYKLHMKKIIFATGTIRGISSWPYLFAKGLSENGFDVTVVSGYANINVSDDYRNHQLSNPIEVISSSFRIIRVGSKKKDPKNLLGRCYKYLHLTRAIFREIKRHKVDYYLFYSTPPFLGLIGCRLRKLGYKTIYIAQDLFPDSLFAVKPRLERTLFGSFLRRLETKIYDNNFIVTISKTMAENIKLYRTNPNIKVIYNWTNISELNCITRINNPLFDEFNISRNRFIVSYAGSIGPLQNIDLLLDVAKEMIEHTNVEFVIFGNGICRDQIASRIQNEKIVNVHLLPLQAANRLSEVYSLGDIEYVSVGAGIMKMACPHKIFDIFSVGRPIMGVFESDCDIAEIINNNNLGIVTNPDVSSIKSSIIDLCNQREKLEAMGIRAREFAERLDYKFQIEKYVSYINSINNPCDGDYESTID